MKKQLHKVREEKILLSVFSLEKKISNEHTQSHTRGVEETDVLFRKYFGFSNNLSTVVWVWDKRSFGFSFKIWIWREYTLKVRGNEKCVYH